MQWARRGTHFNPRSPRGLRLATYKHRLKARFQSTQPKRAATLTGASQYLWACISIHAAQEGCDCITSFQSGRGLYDFNPRSPRGLRLFSSAGKAQTVLFQSTQPKRAATMKSGLWYSTVLYFNPRSPRGLRPCI